MTWATFKVTLRKAAWGWRFWSFCALWMVSATSYESFGIYAQFQLWLKSTNQFSVQQVSGTH
jgi:cytochrome c-type biogenesis protein CcmH/NrfG